MKIQHFGIKHRAKLASLDFKVLATARNNSNLLTAIAAVITCVWALSTHQAWTVLGIVLTGAVSYSLGFTTSIVMALLFIVASDIRPTITLPFVATQMVGYLSVVWLGYRHKEEKILEEVRMSQANHPDQVVPWVVVNEVRTSLAAVRFLLFPVHDDKKTQELQKATLELSRLEGIFREMEKKDQKQNLP